MKFLPLIFFSLLIASCAPRVTRDEAIATAYRYTQVEWMPEERHVVLFVAWNSPGREIVAYEAGPFPVWRVSACGLDADKLRAQVYAPWRCRGMAEDASPQATATP